MADPLNDRLKRMKSDIQKALAAGQAEAVKDALNASYESLVVKAQEDVQRIPEPLFRQVFLPYFSGEQTSTDKHNIAANWIGVAGSPYAEVSVIDPANGRELFRVPPMMTSAGIDTTKSEHGNLGEMIDQYIVRKNVLPQMGAGYLMNETVKRIADLDLSEKEKAQEQWRPVAEYYGYIKADVGTVSADSDRQAAQDDVEYD